MLSTSEVSRLTLTPLSKVLRAVKRGLVSPDYTAMDRRLFLFREDRLPAIKAQMENL